MLHNFGDGSCSDPNPNNNYALYTLRTSSSCILYDTFCDTLMFTGKRRFFVAAVRRRPGGEEIFSDYVYSDSDGNVPAHSCGIPSKERKGEREEEGEREGGWEEESVTCRYTRVT